MILSMFKSLVLLIKTINTYGVCIWGYISFISRNIEKKNKECGEGGLFGQVKSVVIKISFNKGGVTLVCTCEIWGGSSWSSQICRRQNFLYWAGGLILVYTHSHARQTR